MENKIFDTERLIFTHDQLRKIQRKHLKLQQLAKCATRLQEVHEDYNKALGTKHAPEAYLEITQDLGYLVGQCQIIENKYKDLGMRTRSWLDSARLIPVFSSCSDPARTTNY